eukprot:g4937.t1
MTTPNKGTGPLWLGNSGSPRKANTPGGSACRTKMKNKLARDQAGPSFYNVLRSADKRDADRMPLKRAAQDLEAAPAPARPRQDFHSYHDEVERPPPPAPARSFSGEELKTEEDRKRKKREEDTLLDALTRSLCSKRDHARGMNYLELLYSGQLDDVLLSGQFDDELLQRFLETADENYGLQRFLETAAQPSLPVVEDKIFATKSKIDGGAADEDESGELPHSSASTCVRFLELRDHPLSSAKIKHDKMHAPREDEATASAPGYSGLLHPPAMSTAKSSCGRFSTNQPASSSSACFFDPVDVYMDGDSLGFSGAGEQDQLLLSAERVEGDEGVSRFSNLKVPEEAEATLDDEKEFLCDFVKSLEVDNVSTSRRGGARVRNAFTAEECEEFVALGTGILTRMKKWISRKRNRGDGLSPEVEEMARLQLCDGRSGGKDWDEEQQLPTKGGPRECICFFLTK